MDRAGTLDVVDGRYVLRFERRLAHPVEKVWRAVTDPAELAAWFPARVELELAVGGKVRWVFPGDIELPDGRVTELEPPHVLEYTMSSAGMPFAGTGDERTLRFELHPDPAGCLLVFTNTFGDRAGAASFAAGWESCLYALAQMLDGGPVDVPDRYADQHEEYVARFGLVAGTAEETATGWTVRFERQLTHPVAEVWAALTGANPPDAAQPAVGSPPPVGLTNGYVPADAVTAVDPPTLVEYTWRHDGSPAGRVRVELSPGPGGARLVLTQTLPRELAGELPTALAAWHTQLELLAEHLRGNTICPWPEDRTEELRKHYAERGPA